MEQSGKHLQGGIQLTENDLRNHVSDLFSPISVEVSITGGRLHPIDPSKAVTFGQNIFEFNISPLGHQYIVPQLCRMSLSYKIVQVVNGVKADITAAHDVAPINLIGTSMWDKIEIFTNGSVASDCTNEHANYKAYQEITHTYGQDARTTHLTGYGVAYDDADRFDDVGVAAQAAAGNVAAVAATDSRNAGHNTRKAATALSVLHHLYHPIHSDFFQLSKAILPLKDFKVRFTKARDEFLLKTKLAAPTFKIDIVSFRLWIRFCDMHHDIIAEHKMLLSRNIPCRYAAKKTEIKTFTIEANTKSVRYKLFQTEVLPKTLFIGLVHSDAILGNSKLNPYNFNNYGLNSLYLKINGFELPSERYQPDFATNDYMRLYRDFFDNTGVHSNDYGSVMTQKLFKNGMFTPAFDLTPDMCNGTHFHAAQKGVIEIYLELAAELNHGLNLVVFSYFDVILTIDNASKITVIKNPVEADY